MSDIVERLLAFRPPYGWPEEVSTIIEPPMNKVAADEILRLRTENEELRRLNGNCDRHIKEVHAAYMLEHSSIRAENDRLQKYEKLVQYIANDYWELSHDKIKWLYTEYKNKCRKLIEEDHDDT